MCSYLYTRGGFPVSVCSIRPDTYHTDDLVQMSYSSSHPVAKKQMIRLILIKI